MYMEDKLNENKVFSELFYHIETSVKVIVSSAWDCWGYGVQFCIMN